MKKEMLINAVQPEECRIAILENGVLEELYVERTSAESYVGNIYKGRIVNIEPSIQAAFVDFGVGRNGFLHVSDVEPAYYRHLLKDEDERSNRRRGGGGGRRRSVGVSRPGVVIPPAPKAEPEEEADLPPEEFDEVMEEMEDFDTPIDEDQDDAIPDDIEELVDELEIDLDDLNARSASMFAPGSLLPPGLGDPAEISLLGEPENVAGRIHPADEAEESGEDQLKVWDESEGGAVELDEPEVDPEMSKPKKQGRGQSHRNKTISEEFDSESEPAEEDSTEEEEDKSTLGSEQSLPMDSAEHRTREQIATAEMQATEEDEATADFSDADLSFSLRRSEPEPADEQEEPAEEEAASAEEWQETPSYTATEVSELEEPEEQGVAPSAEPEPEPAVARPALADLDDEEDIGYMPRRSSRGSSRNRRGGPNRRGGGGGGGRGMMRPKPLIQDIFKKGQEVLVQVIKEGIGTKGPTLSTYISIAGRYLVLMPGLNRIGVSRKIQDEEQRRNLRDILSELKPPRGLGFIIRTAGYDRSKKELQRDLAYLSRLWEVVVRRIRKTKSPAEIYQESDMITRTIRDTFSSDIQTIWVDDPRSYEAAKEFLQIVMPRYANRIKLHEGSEPMFHKYGIEQEINKIHEKHVPLPNGGSIVIEQTEALVAIDVNSGNFRADRQDAEETAYQMNLAAAREIARQLRLRDMGGVIVNDFIDMRDERHRRNIERALRDAVRRDRARTKILRMSAFGIIEMTRQRIRPSLKRSVYTDCRHCSGSGLVKTTESMSIDVMRMLQLAAQRSNVTEIQVKAPDEVCSYILNRKRQELVRLEEETGTKIEISGDFCAAPEFLEFVCYDNNGNELRFPSRDEPRKRYEGRR